MILELACRTIVGHSQLHTMFQISMRGTFMAPEKIFPRKKGTACATIWLFIGVCARLNQYGA